LVFGPAVVHEDGLVLDISSILKALAESAQKVRGNIGRLATEIPDHRHRWLLRARRERPRDRRAAEQRDELAAPHSIKGAAMISILHDLLVFSCLAAFVTGIVLAAASLLI
jgi:hypothetical protein